MQGIVGIHHVGLRVRDLKISRSFYEQLGFKFIIGPVGPEPVAILIHPSGVNVNLILNATIEAPITNILMEEKIKYPGYTHIALEISDAATMSKQIESIGITITERVEYNGAQFFFIRDPDNNVIEFHQPASS